MARTQYSRTSLDDREHLTSIGHPLLLYRYGSGRRFEGIMPANMELRIRVIEKSSDSPCCLTPKIIDVIRIAE